MKTVAYVADTIALARYFEDALPKAANSAFTSAEVGKAMILVPEIVIAEFIYTALKGRLRVPDAKTSVLELLSDLETSPFIRQVGVPSKAWEIFLNSNVPEMHDRIIYTIALYNHANSIITNDSEIKASGFPTIW